MSRMILMSWELRTGATVREEEFGGADGIRPPDPTMPLWSSLFSIVIVRFFNNFGEKYLDQNCE